MEQPLPTDVESLQKQVLDLSGQLDFFVQRSRHLEEQIALLRGQLFGRKTQKLAVPEDDRQMRLFNEAEDLEAEVPEEAGGEDGDEIVVAAHRRKKPGRRPLPEDLPRVDVVHDLPEEEKVCACGHVMERIGEEVSEKLDIIPARIVVERHIRPKYACKHCEGVESDKGAVQAAPMPPQLIPQGIVTPGLLAYIIIAKFADALPLYRQEKIFARLGVDLSRQTMAGWMIRVATRLKILWELLVEGLRAGPLIGLDETTVLVMKEPGRKNTTKSYMWVARGGDPSRPVVLFLYDPSRSAEVVKPLLEGYAGYVQTDGWKSYKDVLGKMAGIVLVNCWAHARAKFVDVLKARKQKKGGIKSGVADKALSYIRALYRIESHAEEHGLTPDEIKELRREQSKPILDEFFEWLEECRPKVNPGGLLGKAIQYALNHRDALTVFLEDGRIRLDNNLVENLIRPFVVGRKNWLFSGSPAGAHASALLFTLIENAKANGLEPYAYLRYLLEKFPYAETREDFRALLPQYIDPEVLKAYMAEKSPGVPGRTVVITE